MLAALALSCSLCLALGDALFPRLLLSWILIVEIACAAALAAAWVAVYVAASDCAPRHELDARGLVSTGQGVPNVEDQRKLVVMLEQQAAQISDICEDEKVRMGSQARTHSAIKDPQRTAPQHSIRPIV